MRKEVAVARGLPFEDVAQILRLEGNQNEVRLSGKMPARGFANLMRGREVNEPVAPVDL